MALYPGVSCAAPRLPHPPPAVHDLSLESLKIPPLGSAQITFSCPWIIFFALTKRRAAVPVGELSLQPPPPGGRGFPRENKPPNPSPALVLPGGLGKDGSKSWECRGGRRCRSREQRPGLEPSLRPALMWQNLGPIQIIGTPPRLALIPRTCPAQAASSASLHQLCFCYISCVSVTAVVLLLQLFSRSFAVLIPLTLMRAVRSNLQAWAPVPEKYPTMSFPPAEVPFFKR